MEWHSSQPLTLARCFSGSLITVHILLYLRWCRNALGRAQLHVFMASPCTVKGRVADVTALRRTQMVCSFIRWLCGVSYGHLHVCLEYWDLSSATQEPRRLVPPPVTAEHEHIPGKRLERYAVTIQTCFTQIVLMSLFLSPSDWESVYVLVEYRSRPGDILFRFSYLLLSFLLAPKVWGGEIVNDVLSHPYVCYLIFHLS